MYRHGLKGGGTLLNLYMHETISIDIAFERRWNIMDSINAGVLKHGNGF
jgi:hypothetical protein